MAIAPSETVSEHARGDARADTVMDGSEQALSNTDVREATFRGVRWFGLSSGFSQAISVLAAVVLARLVSPAEFGRLAIAIVVSEFALMFANETIGTPLVQRAGLTREHLESATLLGLMLGVGMALLTLLAVPFVTTPLFGARTSELFRLFAPAFALAGVSIVPQARLQRELRFPRIGMSEFAGGVVSALVSVGLAIPGLGAKAYVLGVLAGQIVVMTGYLTAESFVWPRWHAKEMREILGFGIPASAAGFAQVWYRNIDYLILGVRLSATSVGFYYRAFTIGVEYERRLSGIVARIAFPVFTRTEDSARRLALRLRIVRTNVVLVYPMLTLFVALAPTLMPWAFGARWAPAVLPAQILAVAGMASCVRNLTSPSVLAAGRPRAMFVFSLLETVFYGTTVWIAGAYGLTVVCICVSAFQVVSLLLAYTVLLHSAIGVPRTQIFRDLGPAVCASAPTLVVAMALRAALAHQLPAPAVLVVAGLGGGMAYLLALRALSGSAWADVAMLIRRVAPFLLRRSRSVPVSGAALAPASAQRASS